MIALDDLPPVRDSLTQAGGLETYAVLGVTALFLAVLLWRIRPTLPLAAPRDREALRAAQEKVASATTAESRALALCDAGELCAARARRVGAEGFFRRALLEYPNHAVLVRAHAALKRWPRTAEAVFWRALATTPKHSKEFETHALKALIEVLDLQRTRRTQAQALRNLLESSSR
jgi:hypothetical protein